MSEEKKIQPYKTEAVETIRGRFKDVKGYIFTDYRGLTVAQITDLRNKLRGAGSEFKVMKNAFAKIVLHEMDLTKADHHLVGPTAVAYSKNDAGAAAKILFEATKETKLQVKGSLIDGMVFDKNQTEAFSKLPSKLELISMLMSTMKAPLQNFVYVINGVTTKLVRTLVAVADQKAGK